MEVSKESHVTAGSNRKTCLVKHYQGDSWEYSKKAMRSSGGLYLKESRICSNPSNRQIDKLCDCSRISDQRLN